MLINIYVFESVPSVKVEDLPETPSLKKRGSGASGRTTFKDLSREASTQFDVFKLHAYNALSELDPWAALSDGQIVKIWNALPGSSKMPLSSDKTKDEEYARFSKVKILVSSFK